MAPSRAVVERHANRKHRDMGSYTLAGGLLMLLLSVLLGGA